MNASDGEARRAAWSDYWSRGALHSCVGSYAGNYGGAIATYWRTVFATLPRGARVLDVGTGNGPLPRLLLDARPDDSDLHVDAIDLAALAPRWAAQPAYAARVRFHPGVATEHLPFAAAAFDLVTSQFGFEYAERGPALAECLRVLAPSGQLALVMHHADSRLAHVARTEDAHAGRLLAADGLLAATAGVAQWIAIARSGGDPSAEPAAARDRDLYNRAQRALESAVAGSDVPDLLVDARDRAQRLLAAVGPDPAPAREAIAAWRTALERGRLRSRELVSCALDAAAIDAMVAALRAARPGAAIGVQPVTQAEGLLGWGLWMRAPA